MLLHIQQLVHPLENQLNFSGEILHYFINLQIFYHYKLKSRFYICQTIATHESVVFYLVVVDRTNFTWEILSTKLKKRSNFLNICFLSKSKSGLFWRLLYSQPPFGIGTKKFGFRKRTLFEFLKFRNESTICLLVNENVKRICAARTKRKENVLLN